MKKTFVAYVEYDPESKLYIGLIPSIPGVHTAAETLDELREKLKEVTSLCLEEMGEKAEDVEFIGIQNIEVEV